MLLQVIVERGETHDQRPALAEGPQAHIHSKDETVFGSHIEQPDELAPEAVEIFFVVDHAGAVGFTGLRKKKHEVDVGRKIQLAPPSFPMPSTISGTSDRPPSRGFPNGILQMRAAPPPPPHECTPSARFGQRTQGFGHARMAGDVAPRDAQHFPASPLAQQPLRVGARGGAAGAPFVLAVRGSRDRGRSVGGQPSRAPRILDQHRSGKLAPRDEACEFRLQRLGIASYASRSESWRLARSHQRQHRFAQHLGHGFEPADGRGSCAANVRR